MKYDFVFLSFPINCSSQYTRGAITLCYPSFSAILIFAFLFVRINVLLLIPVVSSYEDVSGTALTDYHSRCVRAFLHLLSSEIKKLIAYLVPKTERINN